MLIAFFNRKKLKDHDKHKEVIYRQRFFDEVPREELKRCTTCQLLWGATKRHRQGRICRKVLPCIKIEQYVKEQSQPKPCQSCFRRAADRNLLGFNVKYL